MKAPRGEGRMSETTMIDRTVCRTEDIALSVLATVIGHQREKGWILVDSIEVVAKILTDGAPAGPTWRA
jgi:D-serine deaminase-like pyridoxal phosphate-dependent protein